MFYVRKIFLLEVHPNVRMFQGDGGSGSTFRGKLRAFLSDEVRTEGEWCSKSHPP